MRRLILLLLFSAAIVCADEDVFYPPSGDDDGFLAFYGNCEFMADDCASKNVDVTDDIYVMSWERLGNDEQWKQGFFRFDTSALPDDANISAVEFTLRNASSVSSCGTSGIDFIAHYAETTWPLSTDDNEPDPLNDLTEAGRIACITTKAVWVVDFTDFTGIVLDGHTTIVVWFGDPLPASESDEQNDSYFNDWDSLEEYRPTLTVTYTTGGVAAQRYAPIIMD